MLFGFRWIWAQENRLACAGAVFVGHIYFAHLQIAGRRPPLLHLSGFPLVIPSARGRDEIYHLGNLPWCENSISQIWSFVKHVFVFDKPSVLLRFNVLERNYRVLMPSLVCRCMQTQNKPKLFCIFFKLFQNKSRVGQFRVDNIIWLFQHLLYEMPVSFVVVGMVFLYVSDTFLRQNNFIRDYIICHARVYIFIDPCDRMHAATAIRRR